MAFRNAPVATLLCMLLLGGCATSTVQIIARDPAARPQQVVLIESPNSVDQAALRNVFAPDTPQDSEEASKLVKSDMAEVDSWTMVEMKNALTNVAM